MLQSQFMVVGLTALLLSAPVQTLAQGSRSRLAEQDMRARLPLIDRQTPQRVAQLISSSKSGNLDSQSSALYDGSYFETYRFDGLEGEQITIEVSSQDFDAYMMLLDPTGAFIDHSDNYEGIRMAPILNSEKLYPHSDPSQDSTDAFLIITLPSTGTYQVIVNSRESGETGHYKVSWRQSTAADLVKAPPNVISSRGSAARFKAGDFEYQLNNLRNEKRYEEAIAFAKKQLEITRQYDGKYSYNIFIHLRRIANLHIELQQFEKAEEWYSKVLALHTKQPQLAKREGFNEVVESLNGLASLYQAQGRFDKAIEISSTLEDISPDSRGTTPSPQKLEGELEQALIYRSQGRYDEAEVILIEALDREIDMPFVDNLTLSEVLERFDLELLEMLSPPYEGSDPDVAIILNHLAMLNYLQGRYDYAEALFKEAIAMFNRNSQFPTPQVYAFQRERLAAIRSDIALTVSNLAILYGHQGRYTEAEPLLIQALQILQVLEFGDYADDVVAVLQNLDWSNQSFRFSENAAIVFGRLADLYAAQKRYGEADKIYRKNLGFYRQQFGERHPQVSATLTKLSLLHQRQRNVGAALKFLQQGLDTEDYHLNLNLSNLTEAQGQNYITNIIQTTHQATSLNLQQAPNDETAKQLALTTLLRRKGRILDIASSGLQTLRQNLTPENQELLDKLIARRTELSTLLFNPLSNQKPDIYRAKLVSLETEIDSLESTLARRSALFRPEVEPVQVATLQTRIPENGVLVEYARYLPFDAQAAPIEQWGNPRYAAYLLFSDGRIEAIDLGDAAEIDTAVREFNSLLQDPNASLRAGITVTRIPQQVESVTDGIKTLVLEPIAPYLEQVDSLLISPDGQLNRLPFEALQLEAGGDYLVQQYEISYLNSGRDLLKLGVREPSKNPAVIFANPDYNTAAETMQIATGDKRGLKPNRRSSILSQIKVGPLPGTEAEAVALKSSLPNATLFTTDEATENELKQINAPRLLHIATHGFFLPDKERAVGAPPKMDVTKATSPITGSADNPLLRSGLALAGFNQRDSGTEDGVLTALEASTLNLFGTQLVVLSACETGLGDIANGEGVYGLRRAFAMAGAETQLMSLWKVDDYGTQSLMAQYYNNLTDGMGRGEALRAAQLEMINASGKFSNPYYWSAFILAGDWRPL